MSSSDFLDWLSEYSKSASLLPSRAPPRPGCHPETPAIAHRADAAVLDPQPAGGPIPCRNYTGFAGGESRIEVNDHGTVFFSPVIRLLLLHVLRRRPLLQVARRRRDVLVHRLRAPQLGAAPSESRVRRRRRHRREA